jgi:small subunit ribosomal protein S17
MTQNPTKKIETLDGVVRSAKSQKTISVAVERMVKHPKYSKVMRRESVFRVHDEKGEAREGDLVSITASRPISKTKHFRLVKVLKRMETV